MSGLRFNRSSIGFGGFRIGTGGYRNYDRQNFRGDAVDAALEQESRENNQDRANTMTRDEMGGLIDSMGDSRGSVTVRANPNGTYVFLHGTRWTPPLALDPAAAALAYSSGRFNWEAPPPAVALSPQNANLLGIAYAELNDVKNAPPAAQAAAADRFVATMRQAMGDDGVMVRLREPLTLRSGGQEVTIPAGTYGIEPIARMMGEDLGINPEITRAAADRARNGQGLGGSAVNNVSTAAPQNQNDLIARAYAELNEGRNGNGIEKAYAADRFVATMARAFPTNETMANGPMTLRAGNHTLNIPAGPIDLESLTTVMANDTGIPTSTISAAVSRYAAMARNGNGVTGNLSQPRNPASTNVTADALLQREGERQQRENTPMSEATFSAIAAAAQREGKRVIASEPNEQGGVRFQIEGEMVGPVLRIDPALRDDVAALTRPQGRNNQPQPPRYVPFDSDLPGLPDPAARFTGGGLGNRNAGALDTQATNNQPQAPSTPQPPRYVPFSSELAGPPDPMAALTGGNLGRNGLGNLDGPPAPSPAPAPQIDWAARRAEGQQRVTANINGVEALVDRANGGDREAAAKLEGYIRAQNPQAAARFGAADGRISEQEETALLNLSQLPGALEAINGFRANGVTAPPPNEQPRPGDQPQGSATLAANNAVSLDSGAALGG